MDVAPSLPGAVGEIPRRPTVVVVGATGLVGEVLLRVLEERDFPVGELRALAGPSRAERHVRFRGVATPVGPVGPEAFRGAHLVFFAATGALSKELAPVAVGLGARVVDKSATWRMHPEVPLVVPEIHGRGDEAAWRGDALVSCPNCTTIGLAMALAPLQRTAGLERVVVTTLQAASGAGRAGLEALERSAAPEVFPAPLAGNVVPLCGDLDGAGSSEEERRLVRESRRILGDPDLDLHATCVRVPVAIGHGAAIWVRTREPLDAARAREALGAFPGVHLVELGTPRDAAGGDRVLVSRVRESGDGLMLWQVADNLRKGAATNAVQIAEGWLPRSRG